MKESESVSDADEGRNVVKAITYDDGSKSMR